MTEKDKLEIQFQIAKTLGVNRNFDVTFEISERVKFLEQMLISTNKTGYVLGISGGQDSCLAGRLAQMAINKLNGNFHTPKYKFLAINLPYKIQKDKKFVKDAIYFIDSTNYITLNIGQTVDMGMLEIIENCKSNKDEHIIDFNKGNMKARMRMIFQYAISGFENLLVIGTDHAAEAITGFYTKYGDGGSDLNPLSGLTKSQGREMLKYLGGPESIINKVPTADLLDGNPNQPDEIELKVSYEDIDNFLMGEKVSDEVFNRIYTLYKNSEHKRQMPLTFQEWRNKND